MRRDDTEMTVVIAGYDSMEGARAAFVTLQNRGVDAADIRLTGAQAEQSERRARGSHARDRIDRRLAGHVGRRVLLGAIAGAILGGLVGVVAAWLLLVAMDDVGRSGSLFGLVVGVFAAIGAVLSVFVTFERSVGMDDTWQIMLDDLTDAGICLAVRVRDEHETEQVRSTFEVDDRVERIEVRRANAKGTHAVRTNRGT